MTIMPRLGIHRGMTLHTVLYLIGAVVAGVAIFVVPARYNLLAAALCLGLAGATAQSLGA